MLKIFSHGICGFCNFPHSIINKVFMKRYLNLLLLCLSLSADIALSAQDSVYSAMKTGARKLFEDRNYDKALPIYRELLNRFPKEPEYQYGTAVCLARLNLDPEEALSLLRSVSTTGYNPLSYYYLGVLLHRSYLFEDAIRAYSRFIQAGKSADIKALEVERQIEMAKNGIGNTRKLTRFRVLDVQTLHTDQLERASEIIASGKLVKKPVEFCSRNDFKEGYRPLMFLPVNTEINNYVFISGYEKHKKNRKQIYRVRNINHETWGMPELLNEAINTPYDDEYPFFDARTSILYFSSRGHSSMGGYDIFRSVYDRNTGTWSAPENMGFPVNSPDDDFYYMTDDISQTASFISNRNSAPGMVSLYKIKMIQETADIMPATVDEIQKASILQAEPAITPVLAGNAAQNENVPVSATGKSRTSRNEYNKVLAEALNMQLRSDSLGRIARDKRLAAKETTDDALKKQLVAEIIRTEKESKKMQREADLKFAETWKIKGLDTVLIPEDTSVVLLKEKEAPDAPADEFKITDRSIYNPAFPFPKGLGKHGGLIYSIQLGAFSKPRPYDAFGGLSPVCYEPVNNTSILKYYAGVFYSLNGVIHALDQVKRKGLSDAFIVAFFEGKPISTEKAKEIEFEGMKL
jgi:tetratricopeptide (TPR) repeat protein